MFEHDLFGKPLHTFPDHALARTFTSCVAPLPRPLPATRCASGREGRRSASRILSSIFKQPDAQTRLIAPCSSRPQGKPFISVRVSQKERAERLAKNRFRGRPLAMRTSRTPFESQRHTGNGSVEASEDRVNRTGPRKQSFACVPHADGFVGLLDVPGFGACAPAPRSCELSPGHSFVPSAPSAVVSPSASSKRSEDIQSRQSSRTSAPRSTPQDHRGALRIGTGRGQNIPTRMKVNSFRK